ncbi:MAG: hypothetical protein K2N36_00370 [Ruminiclostridium sp.]|nr:hypothetical protein [Ruminiclostridium sp.]
MKYPLNQLYISLYSLNEQGQVKFYLIIRPIFTGSKAKNEKKKFPPKRKVEKRQKNKPKEEFRGNFLSA